MTKKHYSTREMQKLKKSTLIRIARKKGKSVKKTDLKADIIKKIKPLSRTCTIAGRELKIHNSSIAGSKLRNC